ncbi:helix-turn-helix transcriptional regulator [Mesorhizobium sp. 8]|uniref:helix-turn-helix transcriptional regulator n=1 Tax=Mesorhizobium sp. 8 TaxID=2584466 RepID=UPI00111E27D1|nr:helix-turn-helix transcriptional regulator [Mesorhizobium sp. 8]QDC02171.1 helix-turn-helix transcriptional regulator [Mesorhizobium sp. 8]
MFDQKFITDTSAQIAEIADGAVFDATAWDDFIEILGGAFPGACIAFQHYDLRRLRIEYDRILNLGPDYQASYRQHYSGLNPWVQPLRSAPSGTVLVSERDCPSSNFSHTEFYDWLPRDLRAATALILETNRENLAFVGLNYGIDRAGIYDEPALELLRRISRPLSRSMQATRLFGQTVDRERSAAALVSRSGDVACVVDDQLRVRDANPAAELEFRRQKLVTIRAGCLRVTAPGINGWLSDTLRLLAAGLEPDATTRIFLTDGSYQIGLVPLPKRVEIRSPFYGRPLFLLVLRNLSKPAETDTMDELGAAFGLTRAERRLCEMLLRGNSLKESADMLEIAFETARQRLKAIFHKTGIHKQSELIALLGRLL